VLLVAPATAATVSAASFIEFDGRTTLTRITFKAGPGEANDVQVDPASGLVTDAGATVTAGAGCTSVNEHQASCRIATDEVALAASLGDHDDRIRLDKPFSESSVDGAGGNDTISGACYVDAGAGDDIVFGCTSPRLQPRIEAGPGDDLVVGSGLGEVITGGGGRDVLDGGAGDDSIADGDRADAADADQLDGGAGFDTVTSYADRPQPVTVDLSVAAPNGAAGEGDTLQGFEGAVGGFGDDILLGTERGDQLGGHLGADRIEGRGGDDDIAGGEGVDRISGGDGDDTIHGRDQYRDSIDCGPGADHGSADRADRQTACESLATRRRDMLAAVAPAHGGRAGLDMHCFEGAQLLSCAVRVTLRGRIAGRSIVIASGRCTAVSRCGSTLKLSLRPAARRALRHRRLRADATVVRIGNSHGAIPQREGVTLIPSTNIFTLQKPRR
jgi:Ca2+-binding RTX toxin-like protein